MANKKHWGKELDGKLKIILEKMIQDGYYLFPISRSAVQKLLRIKSRSTLLPNNRAELIENAKRLQLKNAGLDNLRERRRKNTDEKLNECQNEMKKYKTENEKLHLTVQAIMYNLDPRCLDVEEIMKPLI